MSCPHCDSEHLDRIICVECGEVLGADDRHYYDGRCNDCETAWHARIAYWRAGGCDPMLDAMFGDGSRKEARH